MYELVEEFAWVVYAVLGVLLVAFIWFGMSRKPPVDVAAIMDRYGHEPADAYPNADQFFIHIGLINFYYAIRLDGTLVKRGSSPPIEYKTSYLAGWIYRK